MQRVYVEDLDPEAPGARGAEHEREESMKIGIGDPYSWDVPGGVFPVVTLP